MKNEEWLRKGIIYEIYPQSFRDGNGDGIGDLKGIREKLDYVKELGCNIIWINACQESAFRDGGYDVTDYYHVAKRYGTNEEMKRLFLEAHERGIRVLLDFVPGHTSDEHPWFREFLDGEDRSFEHPYIWIPEGFEHLSGEEHLVPLKGRRKGYYVANFFDFQPALNYGYGTPDPEKPWQLPVNHPCVEKLLEEMMNVIRFWLELGADGLRVDMAASLVKQDAGSEKTSEIWRKVRHMMEREYPDAILLSEWSDPKVSIKAGFHMDFLIHVNGNAYTSLFRNEHGRNINPGTPEGRSFFERAGEGNIWEFLEEYLEHYQAVKDLGYLCIPSGNHDLPRLSMGRDREDLKGCFTFLLTMPGVPAIYYGDELGMSHQTGLLDKEGGKLGEEEYTNRTGARTPMQWTAERNAGFSEAEKEKLYLPISRDYQEKNVEKEKKDEESLLSYVKKLLALRKQEEAFWGMGGFRVLYAKKNAYPFLYERKDTKGKRFWVILNPSGRNTEAFLEKEDGKEKRIAGKGVTFTKIENEMRVVCEPAAYGIFCMEENDE